MLVRELWIRRRIGWLGLVLLGIGYTALNEGVVAATWSVLFLVTFFALALTGHPAWSTVASLLLFIVGATMLVRWERAEDWTPYATTCLSFGALVSGMTASLANVATLQPVASLVALAMFRRLFRLLRTAPPPA